MWIKRNLPNLLTCLNLFCGTVSIAFAGNNYMFQEAAIILMFAALFDFMDGFVARLLNAYSDIGKELDSLADVVSFGVAPAMLLFNYVERNAFAFEGTYGLQLAWLSCFLLPVAAAVRLAIFNVDTSQKKHFVGLPTPAAALFLISLPFLSDNPYYGDRAEKILLSTPGFCSVLLSVAALMVSRVPLLSLKADLRKWKSYPWHWAFLLTIVVGGAVFRLAAVPVVFLCYCLFSALQFKTVWEKPEPIYSLAELEEEFIHWEDWEEEDG